MNQGICGSLGLLRFWQRLGRNTTKSTLGITPVRIVLLSILFVLGACSDQENNYQTAGNSMLIDADPIIVEQTFDASIETVWEAITDKTQMPQWFFETIAEFEPKLGFETDFTVSAEGQDYQHLWKIIEVIPESKIAYEWRYGGIPGNSTVTWELSETPTGTRLKLTHTGHETFPQDETVFNLEAGLAGWKYFIQDSLKAYLEKS